MKEVLTEEEKLEMKWKWPAVLCRFVLQLLFTDKAQRSRNIKAYDKVKSKEKLDKEKKEKIIVQLWGKDTILQVTENGFSPATHYCWPIILHGTRIKKIEILIPK